MAKELFRKFRDFARRSFLVQYQKKQYHWVLNTKRAKVRVYFTLDNPGFFVNEIMYDDYEHVFFELIHPMSRSFDKEWPLPEHKRAQISTIREIMGQKPNRINMKNFFEIPPLHLLFHGFCLYKGIYFSSKIYFKTSIELAKFLFLLNSKEKVSLGNHLDRAGLQYTMLPKDERELPQVSIEDFYAE